MQDHDHDGHEPEHEHGQGHGNSHSHGHGNERDQGLRAMLRYAGHARSMWRSEVNEATVVRLGAGIGQTLADIGAGVGAGTVVAAAAGATVIAVEPTPYMRRILGLRRLGRRARARIRIVDGAAEATGLDDGSVDGAWAVNTMHHWTDLEAGCRELARILGPGGRVVLVDEDFDDPTHPDHARFQERHSGGDHGFHMVEADRVAAALGDAGLEVDSAGKTELAGRPVILVEAHRPGA